ncbi:MAG: hypothetical protein ACOC6B_00160 [Thermodesulfobacteriota bacterium]
MNRSSTRETKAGRRRTRSLFFPALVLAFYGILYALDPDSALRALQASAKIFRTLCLPLALVFGAMFALDLFCKPARIARLFGRDAGIKGVLLSIAAGIISMGPIFAWYPLMKKMSEEGASEGPIAIFLYNRAIKPFLLPVMIAYFGWLYVLILTMLTILGSLVLGYSMNILCRD